VNMVTTEFCSTGSFALLMQSLLKAAVTKPPLRVSRSLPIHNICPLACTYRFNIIFPSIHLSVLHPDRGVGFLLFIL
jgi:hypothetical protein